MLMALLGGLTQDPPPAVGASSWGVQTPPPAVEKYLKVHPPHQAICAPSGSWHHTRTHVALPPVYVSRAVGYGVSLSVTAEYSTARSTARPSPGRPHASPRGRIPAAQNPLPSEQRYARVGQIQMNELYHRSPTTGASLHTRRKRNRCCFA